MSNFKLLIVPLMLCLAPSNTLELRSNNNKVSCQLYISVITLIPSVLPPVMCRFKPAKIVSDMFREVESHLQSMFPPIFVNIAATLIANQIALPTNEFLALPTNDFLAEIDPLATNPPNDNSDNETPWVSMNDLQYSTYHLDHDYTTPPPLYSTASDIFSISDSDSG